MKGLYTALKCFMLEFWDLRQYAPTWNATTLDYLASLPRNAEAKCIHMPSSTRICQLKVRVCVCVTVALCVCLCVRLRACARSAGCLTPQSHALAPAHTNRTHTHTHTHTRHTHKSLPFACAHQVLWADTFVERPGPNETRWRHPVLPLLHAHMAAPDDIVAVNFGLWYDPRNPVGGGERRVRVCVCVVAWWAC
jgi:hypothetical protein